MRMICYISLMIRLIAWLCVAASIGVGGCAQRESAAGPVAPAPVAAVPVAADAGERLFEAQCVACHQHDARGLEGVYPSLVGSPVLLGDVKQLTLWVIRGKRPPTLPAGRYPTMMLQFGWMKAPAAARLFTYLRSLFGNAAPAVESATVADAVRQ